MREKTQGRAADTEDFVLRAHEKSFLLPIVNK